MRRHCLPGGLQWGHGACKALAFLLQPYPSSRTDRLASQGVRGRGEGEGEGGGRRGEGEGAPAALQGGGGGWALTAMAPLLLLLLSFVKRKMGSAKVLVRVKEAALSQRYVQPGKFWPG